MIADENGTTIYNNSILISVRPRLPADLDYRLNAHRLSTYILRIFTRLYGKVMRSSVYARRMDQRF